MPDSPESKNPGMPTFDPAIQSENIAFSPDAMLSCNGCSRQNPPNRSNCLYCGLQLADMAEHLDDRRPVTRELEAWESGFNIIARSASDGYDLSAASKIVSDDVDLKGILESRIPMPVARFESLKLAEESVSRMQRSGINCSVVSDADLDVELPPIRLSAIEISGGSFRFTDFNTHTAIDVAFDDLALIVTGQLTRTRTDVIEKRKRKGAEVIDEAASFSDEKLLDIYTIADSRGFRIYPAGFDFSFLGADKSLLARENIDRVVTFISDHAGNVRVITNYVAVRHFLAPAWQIESRSDAQGIIRAGFGKRGFGKVETTSNLRQYTKYSRLQWHLL